MIRTIEWTDDALELLIKATEYDVERCGGEENYEEFISLHKNKFDYLIKKGRFKTQQHFIDELFKYKNIFKCYLDNNMYLD